MSTSCWLLEMSHHLPFCLASYGVVREPLQYTYLLFLRRSVVGSVRHPCLCLRACFVRRNSVLVLSLFVRSCLFRALQAACSRGARGSGRLLSQTRVATCQAPQESGSLLGRYSDTGTVELVQ